MRLIWLHFRIALPAGCFLLMGSILTLSLQWTLDNLWRYSTDDYNNGHANNLSAVQHAGANKYIKESYGRKCYHGFVLCVWRFGCVTLKRPCVKVWIYIWVTSFPVRRKQKNREKNVSQNVQDRYIFCFWLSVEFLLNSFHVIGLLWWYLALSNCFS